MTNTATALEALDYLIEYAEYLQGVLSGSQPTQRSGASYRQAQCSQGSLTNQWRLSA